MCLNIACSASIFANKSLHDRLHASETDIDATQMGEESQRATDMLAEIQSTLEMVKLDGPCAKHS